LQPRKLIVVVTTISTIEYF